ncbi:hypothetical protein MW887_006509 [Aspergillus wentii]|nr:hypothetical protein MW887_006509 [Aspergillus wentii]
MSETTIEAVHSKRPASLRKVVTRVSSWSRSRKGRHFSLKKGFRPVEVSEVSPAASILSDESIQEPTVFSPGDSPQDTPDDTPDLSPQEEPTSFFNMEGKSELIGAPATDSPQTIMDRFRDCVARYPDNLAVVCTHQPAGLYGCQSVALEDEVYKNSPYLRWTYRDLARGVQRLVAAFGGKEITRGTPLYMFSSNRVEYVMTTLAAYTLGLVHVPLNPTSLENAAEVRHMIRTVVEFQTSSSAVILANDVGIANALDEIKPDDLTCAKIVIDGTLDGWDSFSTLMQADDASYEFVESGAERSVLFTSGTTSLPKGCLIKVPAWVDTLNSSLSLGTLQPSDLVAVAVPNNHAFGWICLMIPLLRGTAVAFAGPKFAPGATLDAIQQEKCTHLTMVPTMLHSIVQVKSEYKQRTDSLRGFLFGGMTMSPAFLKMCQYDLGVPTIENLFGMTEGVFSCTGIVSDMQGIVNEMDVSIGHPIHGSHVRICAPGERTPLPKGELGQLHFSSSTMIDGYMGKDSDDFYEADGKPWFITGDQAFVDTSNRLYITGRYKDLVVRGGENLSAAKVEATLGDVPELRSLEPQIVAGKDPIAGEVPVLIVNEDVDQSVVKQIKDTIRERLGVIYVPNEVISLQALQLQDYPRTTSGKIQKSQVAGVVHKYRDAKSKAMSEDSLGDDLKSKVIREWSRVLGLEVNQIDINISISKLADSILLLSARDRIKKETGRSVPLSEWTAVDSIAEQIQLLENVSSSQNTLMAQPKRAGPPSVDDIVHLGGDSEEFDATKAAVESAINSYGLSWEDVDDVMPTTDYTAALCKSRCMDMCRIGSSTIVKDVDGTKLRNALEAALAINPILTSFFVGDEDRLGPDVSLHVTIGQTKSFLDRCISDYGVINTMDEVKSMVLNYPFRDHALLPGPLFRAMIAFVPEINSHVLITYISHTVIDKTYHGLFMEDIDRALTNQPLRPHVPFKHWADSYHTLRTSPMANTAVRFHANYLKDIHDHKHALWPHPTKTITVSPDRKDTDGHFTSFPAPSFLRLRDKHPGITPPIIMKSALALLAIYHTNHTHALFGNFEAARKQYPFVPDSYNFSDAADVGGPTFTGVLNLVDYQPEETVLAYLQRMQHYQAKLTQHASVPWNEVFRKLGGSASEVLSAVTSSLNFNWMPGLGAMIRGGNPYEKLELAQVSARTNVGMVVNSGAIGDDGSQIVILIQGAVSNRSTQWVTRVAEHLKKIALWMADEESYHRPVGDFIECLD